jgi:hypothetical protein
MDGEIAEWAISFRRKKCLCEPHKSTEPGSNRGEEKRSTTQGARFCAHKSPKLSR